MMRFAERLVRVDKKVMGTMNDGEFTFTRLSGELLRLSCIYETALQEASGNGSSTAPRQPAAVIEHGRLVVLGALIEREILWGASVNTPRGQKVVAAVSHTDSKDTVMVLGPPGGELLPKGDGVRFTKS